MQKCRVWCGIEPLPKRAERVIAGIARPQESIQLLGPSGGLSVERLMARGHAYRRSGDRFAALRAYAAARLLPGNREATRGTAAVLTELGAPHAAERFGGTSPSIEAAKAAALVRWGEDVKPRDPARRFDGTDKAMTRLDALLQTTTDPDVRRRLRNDRIIALRDRFRMEEVVQEIEAMKGSGKDPGALPTYVEEADADALLYLRHPKEALTGYNNALAREPRQVQARYGQFHAAVEAEDFTTAYAAIDILLRRAGVARRSQSGSHRGRGHRRQGPPPCRRDRAQIRPPVMPAPMRRVA